MDSSSFEKNSAHSAGIKDMMKIAIIVLVPDNVLYIYIYIYTERERGEIDRWIDR